MDTNLYEWLNKNNRYDKNSSISLIECVLILSVNSVFISYSNLVQYHKNVIDNIKSSPHTNNILNEKQFQILNKYIQSLHEIFNNNNNNNINDETTTTALIDTSKLYTTNNINSDKIKFNCSIILICENNKNHHNYTTTINKQQSSLSTLSTIAQRNNVMDINVSFFKAWRNIVIRNEILFYSKLYRIYSNKEITTTLKQLSNFKYKNYVNSILVPISPDNFKEKEENKEKNIKNMIYLDGSSFPDTISSISFIGNEFYKPLTKGVFPESITFLEFYDGCLFNQSFGDWIPNSIKTLKPGKYFQQDIKIGQLPESLTKLVLHKNYNGKIDHEAIPELARKEFHFKFGSQKNELKLLNKSIPKSTTSLEFDDHFNQDIISNDLIPHNVTSLKFAWDFKSYIGPNSLPLSLLSLDFGIRGSISDLLLPPNLTSVDMGSFNGPLTPHLFPISITSIVMYRFDQEIQPGYFSNLVNLKKLEFDDLDQIIHPNTFPESLTSLNLGYYMKPFDFINVLPKSLLELEMDNADINLLSGQLPQSITSLNLYINGIDNPILPGVLPNGLKKLILSNLDFNQDLSLDGILPNSLEVIGISKSNINYLNNLDFNFFNKYIKLFD